MYDDMKTSAYRDYVIKFFLLLNLQCDYGTYTHTLSGRVIEWETTVSISEDLREDFWYICMITIPWKYNITEMKSLVKSMIWFLN